MLTMVRERAARARLRRRGDRRRRPAGHHHLHAEGDGRRARGRARAAARGHGVLATRTCTSPSRPSSPAPARCAASTAARTTSSPRSTGPSTGGQVGSTFKPFAVAAALKDGFSLKDTFDGNSPFYYNEEGTGAEVRNEGSGRRARHRLRLRGQPADAAPRSRSTPSSPTSRSRCPTVRTRSSRPPRTSASRAGTRTRAATTTSTTAPASSRSPASRSARPRSRRSTWPTPTPPSPTAARRADAHVDHQGGEQGRRGPLPVQAAHRPGHLRGRRRRHVVRPAAGRQDRHRHRRPGARPARPPARPAPRPTALDQVSSAWFVGYTPQLATAVMYVRGKGHGQLDGWLPAVLRRLLPGAHLDRRDEPRPRGHRGRGVPAARQPRRRRTRRRPRAVRPAAAADEEAEAVEDALGEAVEDADALAHADPDADRRRPPRPRPPTLDSDRPRRPSCTPPADPAVDATGRGRGRAGAARPAAGPAAADGRAGGWIATGWIPPSTTRWSPPSARASAARSARRAGRHPWWTPVRVLLALTAVCMALGMVQKGNCYEDTWQNGQARYTHMCYSDLPYLYTGRGFAELNWPYSDDAAGAGPLRGHGVPRRHLLLGVGHGVGDALAQRLARPRAPVRRTRPTRSPAAPEVQREMRIFVIVNALGFAVLALLCTWLLAGVNPPPAVGRGGVRALAGAAPDRPGQLGPARGRLRGRGAVGLGPGPAAADRRADRARHGDQALSALPARRRAGDLPAPASATATFAVAAARRRRRVAAGQPAGAADRAVGVEGLLDASTPSAAPTSARSGWSSSRPSTRRRTRSPSTRTRSTSGRGCSSGCGASGSPRSA